MRFNRDSYHRRSIRLRGYDYSQEGLYFITICTHERWPLFGNVKDGGMQLSDAGNIAKREWEKIAEMRPHIALGEFVVMPNHLHGIIAIQEGRMQCAPTVTLAAPVGAHCMRPIPTIPTKHMRRTSTVGDIVRGYKSAVTKQIKQLTNHYDAPVWQRNYYEHIIRNESAHLKIAEYIHNNPEQWRDDTYFVP